MIVYSCSDLRNDVKPKNDTIYGMILNVASSVVNFISLFIIN